MKETRIGEVVHYYGKPKVAVIGLDAPLRVGDKIHVRGAHDDFMQEVKEMQYDHSEILKGMPGQQVGVKVGHKVHDHDAVFFVTDNDIDELGK